MKKKAPVIEVEEAPKVEAPKRERVVVTVERPGKRPAQHGVFITTNDDGTLYVEPDSYGGAPFTAKDMDEVQANMPR